MTIAVAVSGGTDSLYALASLCRKFSDPEKHVFAVHAHFKDPSPTSDPVADLTERCRELGVKFYVLELQKQFSQLIVQPFVDSYAAGLTPNPCVQCNAKVKFGLLYDECHKLGANCIATGHYVRIEDHPRYGLAIRQGEDETKDQSYFLALTPRERLSRAIFPLGGMRKSHVREILKEWGLQVPLPSESQEICFIPNDDYRAFLKNSGTRLPGEGPMVLEDGLVVGRHHGLWQYTQGQRRGLGVSWKEPLYVVGKDRSRNALLLGTAREMMVNSCVAGKVNFLVPPSLWPNELYVRVRYRQKTIPADVHLVSPDSPDAARMLIRFHTPQLPYAPDQLAAVFDSDGYVLAGGIILKNT